MATLSASLEGDFKGILKFASAFPNLSGRFLALVGKRARTTLKEKYLSGQEITLRAFPTDSRGRRTIVSDVNKRRTQVKIYSYPVNLFEKGRRLRSGSKEPGKFIITKKLKQDVMSGFAGYVNEWESKVLEDQLRKDGLL